MAKKEAELPPDDAGRVRTVTEFTREVKELLEGGVRPGWVRGEVSNLRAQASGHIASPADAAVQGSVNNKKRDAPRRSTRCAALNAARLSALALCKLLSMARYLSGMTSCERNKNEGLFPIDIPFSIGT